MAADPVDVGSLALAGRFDQTCDAVEDTKAVLTALHTAGWRIVRTSTCQCEVPDVEHFADGHRLDAYPCEERIVAEWTPGAVPAGGEDEQT